MTNCKAVFEGGGVKGIGLAGAAAVFEKAGYYFAETAGTSAGAIVASLLASGYDPTDLYGIMMNLDFKNFRGESTLHKFGLLGKGIRLAHTFGVYKTDFLEKWLGALMKVKGVEKFADLKQELSVVASDISGERMLVLPRDLKNLGIDPRTFSVAAAVRMSMSIPLYFDPYTLETSDGPHYIADGGLLSNYPIWLLDRHTNDLPVFGFRFTREEEEGGGNKGIHSLVGYAMSLADTLLDAHDRYYESRKPGDPERTIVISANVTIDGQTKNISATDFDLTNDEKQALYDNGQKAAENFLQTWKFDAWKEQFGRKRHHRVQGS